VYDDEELPAPVDADTAGLLYVGLVAVDAAGLDAVALLPEDTDVFCLDTALLAADVPEDTFVALELREVLPELIVPLLVLLLVPVPLLTVVLVQLSVNTLVSVRVSWRGPYHVLLPKCPPLPLPGPCPWP
jgi:hypothetical protein